MSRFKIGTAEACTLFCLGEGATAIQVANATGVHIRTARSRIDILRLKKIVERIDDSGGLATYRPTAAGREIIHKTLNHKTKKHP